MGRWRTFGGGARRFSSISPKLRGPRQIPRVKKLERERDNLRAATRWLLGRGESEEAAGIGWALRLFWWMRGHFTEGRRWMEEALAEGPAIPAPLRAKALFVAGVMAEGQADHPSAETLLEESLALFRELEDKRGTSLALGSLGRSAVGQGRHERGVATLQEAVVLNREIGEKWVLSAMYSFLAGAWFGQGDLARAKRLAERGLALAREVGDDAQALCIALYTLAMTARASSDHERARRLLAEGLEASVAIADESHILYSLQGLASVAASRGSPSRAAR
ncbi:MAG: tetratricopeptide repeat protein, partial [Rubrobacteraceae bacterium]